VFDNAHKYCESGQVMMVVDGDDELIGRQVFQLLNTLYQKQQVWIIYTQSLILRGRSAQVGHS
jgi:hypothetical protein